MKTMFEEGTVAVFVCYCWCHGHVEDAPWEPAAVYPQTMECEQTSASVPSAGYSTAANSTISSIHKEENMN
jgi:hypothetical protein